jgi:hypothetical protein
MHLTVRDGGRPLIALTENAEAIQLRYESLYENDKLYKYLPGNAVDILVNVSGTIFGMANLAKGIASAMGENKAHVSAPFNAMNGMDSLVETISKLEDELDELIMRVENLRKEVN